MKSSCLFALTDVSLPSHISCMIASGSESDRPRRRRAHIIDSDLMQAPFAPLPIQTITAPTVRVPIPSASILAMIETPGYYSKGPAGEVEVVSSWLTGTLVACHPSSHGKWVTRPGKPRQPQLSCRKGEGSSSRVDVEER